MAKQAVSTDLFTINGFTVKENSSYVIQDKRDMDAPTGYINYKGGVSKLPSRGVSESFQVRFVPTDASGKKGIWDTGFDEYSPCYADVSSEEAKAASKGLVRTILEPYRKATGNPEAFEIKPNDHTFFDSLNFKIYTGKTYNTNNAKDRLELYFGLRTLQLTPKGQEGNTKYNDSNYVILDLEDKTKKMNEKAIAKFKAVGAFTGMLTTDKLRLFSILRYMNINVSQNIDDMTLIGMFNDKLEHNTLEDTAGSFVKLVEETNEQIGLDKVVIYSKLRDTHTRGRLEKSNSGVYFYDGLEIGADLKNAALAIAKESRLAPVKKALLLLDDED
jgi:hypothetical protein